jgi:CheY-like chemotaxis protein
MLRRLECAVVVVGDGQAALEALKQQGPFDLVLMDCQMPGMDGFEATRRIRALEAAASSPRQPIVAMTANATDQDRLDCQAAGMDDHLAKPTTVAALTAIIARWAQGGSGTPGSTHG